MPNMRLTTEGFYMFLTMDHSFKWKSLAFPFHGGILFAKTCFHNKLVDIQMCNMIGVVKTNEWKFLKHKNSPYRLSFSLSLSLSFSIILDFFGFFTQYDAWIFIFWIRIRQITHACKLTIRAQTKKKENEG